MEESGAKWVISMLMGEYHHSIDDKGRLTIPAKIRYDLGESFVVTRGLDNCLFVYPMNEWNAIIEKYKELPNTRDARNFMRFFLSGATTCEFDKQGRLKLPQPLIKFADLSKECIIIGVNDRLEIWSDKRWNDFTTENESNLSEIADKLFQTSFN